MPTLVETATHVFEIAMTPDTPGVCRRTIGVRLVSGKSLSDAEWAVITAKLVADYQQRGGKVHRITFGRDN